MKILIEEIEFNVDDMTGEEISYATSKISEAGASEVYTSAISMKKNRPGTLFTVICPKEKHDDILECIFKHTSTIGVRCLDKTAYKMDKKVIEENTKYGLIHKKVSTGFNVYKEKYEFEDLKDIADKNNISIKDLLTKLNKN